MELGLKGKVAAVLASSSGLGLACARALAREGARVGMCGRDPERLRRALESLEVELSAEVLAEPVDVADAGALARHLESVRRRWGAVHVLVTNAGGPPPRTAAETDAEALRASVALTFESALHAIRTVLPWMRAQRWGRIVALTSSSVRQPIPGLALSNAVRAGLTGYLKTLAGEVAAEGITVNSVCTGSFATERLDELFRERSARSGRSAAEERAAALAEIPARRLGQPEELGELVAFLASERAAFLTGVALPLDGGAIRGLL